MKHVREPFPDVRAARPEVSAALAAVIERATAKRVRDRYADADAMIADLEDVLAIEAARAGQATGEVTTVLRTLPRSKRLRVPYFIRHRARWLLSAGSILALAAAAVVWLAFGGSAGRGSHSRTPKILPAPTGTLTSVHLCSTCATGFNPLGNPTDEAPDANLAIDGSTSTYWQTQQYYSDTLNKAGTGLYLTTGTPTSARELKLLTTTPGFTATVYARTSPPPMKWPDAGWVRISSPAVMSSQTAIPLDGGSARVPLLPAVDHQPRETAGVRPQRARPVPVSSCERPRSADQTAARPTTAAACPQAGSR